MNFDQLHEATKSETQLISAAQQGDDFAWEHLVRAHQEASFRLAYLHLGDLHEAEDVVQESFIRAYQAIGRFDIARPFRPWLLRIVANQALNQRRTIGRYYNALKRLLQSEPDIHIPQHSVIQENFEAKTLWQAIQQLRNSDQQIIYLRFFLEMTVSETAETIGVAPGTVKSRLHRALKHLMKVIEQDFPELKEWHHE